MAATKNARKITAERQKLIDLFRKEMAEVRDRLIEAGKITEELPAGLSEEEVVKIRADRREIIDDVWTAMWCQRMNVHPDDLSMMDVYDSFTKSEPHRRMVNERRIKTIVASKNPMIEMVKYYLGEETVEEAADLSDIF